MVNKKQPTYRINLRWFRLLYWPLLLPIALILAVFNKLSPIPFKIYALRVDRIGQMAGNQEEFMCELSLGLHPREFRIFVHRDKPSNSALLAMQKRELPIRQIFLPLFDVCHKLGGLGVSSMKLAGLAGNDAQQLVTKTPQHISFTDKEILSAKAQCRNLGIDPDAPFVPVLGRDSAYLDRIKEPTDADSYRNMDINTFVPALEFLAERFKVIRMGCVVQRELKTNHPNILDYSLSGKRTELLDVFLSANCHFFLSCGTGLDSITSLCFRKPVLYVNLTPISALPIFKPWTIVIPKKYWDTNQKRYLTLSELLDSDIGERCTPRELNPLGIVIHDNTPEEILDATKEMVARLDGTWVESDEDRDLQDTFWSHYKRRSSSHVCVGRIGTKFLKENSYWLI
jgi:putative glycosyltransferase (TIGR04372 family)